MGQNEPVVQVVEHANALKPQRGQHSIHALRECPRHAEEDIPDLGCREGLGEVTSSATKESPLRPFLEWRVKHWTEKWPMVEGEGPIGPPAPTSRLLSR